MRQQARLTGIVFRTFMGVVLVFLAAAAFAQDSSHPSAEKVCVYVYRYKQYVGKALRPSSYCDERDVARLQGSRYTENSKLF